MKMGVKKWKNKRKKRRRKLMERGGGHPTWRDERLQDEWCVEPSGVQCFEESNPLKDDEASTLLDAAVLV